MTSETSRRSGLGLAARIVTTRRLGVFVAGVFLAESAFYAVVPPLVPELVRQTHMTTTQVGVLVAAYPGGVMVAAIPAIAMVNRLGVRVTTTIGLGLLILATLAFAWSTEPLVLDVARLIQGIGGAVAWAAALAWLISQAPRARRATVIGGAVGAALIGMVVGPVIGSAATWIGRGIVFSGIAVVLAAMAALTLVPQLSTGEHGSSFRALLGLLRIRRAALGNALIAVIGVINGTLASLVPLLVSRRLGPPAAIAAIFVASYLLASFWNVVLGRIADRVGRLVPVTVGFTLAAAILPFLPGIGSLVFLATATVIAGSAASGLWTPTAAIVSDAAEAEPSSQAVAVAVTNAAWAAGGAIGAVALSALADTAGFAVPFLLVGILCAFAALICLATLRADQARTEVGTTPRRQT